MTLEQNEANCVIGERITVGGESATVKWIGNLPRGEEGSEQREQIWVGIEYDEAERGKHNGNFEEHQFFEVTQKGAGAFIKPPKVEPGTSLAAAIYAKYVDAKLDDNSPLEIMDDRGRVKSFEFPGREAARQRYATLHKLRDFSCLEDGISHIGNLQELWGKDHQVSIGQLLLDNNLLWSWKEIEYLLEQAPKLSQLFLRGNKLGLMKDPIQNGEKLEAIGLTQCLSDCQEDTLQVFADAFPNLTAFGVAKCNWTSMPRAVRDGCWQNMAWIDLDWNFLDWTVLSQLSNLPSLDILQMSNMNLPDLDFDPIPMPSVTTLYLTDNNFTKWDTFVRVAKCFPSLQHIRISRCGPVLGKDDRLASMARHMIVAIMPDLKFFNGAQIVSVDRISSERYFMSMKMKEKEEAMLFDPDGKHFERLVGVHGEVQQAGKGSCRDDAQIHEELITVKFFPQASIICTMGEITKKLPGSMNIQDIKLLATRLYKQKLPTQHMRLDCREHGSFASFELDNLNQDLNFWGISSPDGQVPTIVVTDTREVWDRDEKMGEGATKNEVVDYGDGFGDGLGEIDEDDI